VQAYSIAVARNKGDIPITTRQRGSGTKNGGVVAAEDVGEP